MTVVEFENYLSMVERLFSATDCDDVEFYRAVLLSTFKEGVRREAWDRRSKLVERRLI